MIKKVVSIKFHPWDQEYDFDPGGLDLKVEEQVIVKTDLGQEYGEVVKVREIEEKNIEIPLKTVVRKVNLEDLKKINNNLKKKPETIKKCQELIQKHNLEMKLVDCHFSYDGGKITFSFTSSGRVDFRNLVKDLARIFQKSIRLQQIGIRDEAKTLGEFGACGRELCCKKFLRNLGNVTTDLAKIQQVTQRGSERISGVCGRLMCCLSYEADFYKEASRDFPEIGTMVKTRFGSGRVISWNVLKQTVNVVIDENNVTEIPIKNIKL